MPSKFPPILAAGLLAACTATPHTARTDGPPRTLIVLVGSDAATRAAYGAAVPGSRVVALDTDAALAALPTRAQLAAAAKDIRAFKARYHPTHTILVGARSSAALVADLMGTQDRIADAMLLGACPCAGEDTRAPTPATPQEARPLDPLQTAGGISPRTRAAIVAAASDTVAPPRLSRTYAEALALRGIAVDYRVLPKATQAILTDPETISALRRLAGMPDKAA